ncbi:MAG: hypothetical protein Q9207_003162 [Kuettlingeria erythrocarpa]
MQCLISSATKLPGLVAYALPPAVWVFCSPFRTIQHRRVLVPFFQRWTSTRDLRNSGVFDEAKVSTAAVGDTEMAFGRHDITGDFSEPNSYRTRQDRHPAQAGHAHTRVDIETDMNPRLRQIAPSWRALDAGDYTPNNKNREHQVRNGSIQHVKTSGPLGGNTIRGPVTSNAWKGRSTATSFQAPLSWNHPNPHRRKALSSHRETWQIQKNALKTKFRTEGWAPRKRLSPDALEGIRALHAQFPDRYTTPVLADQFEVSAEAIRRILKSKWRPNDEETLNRRTRWDKRGERIWSKMVALGVKPPKRWREMGVGRDDQNTELAAKLVNEDTDKGSGRIAPAKQQ